MKTRNQYDSAQEHKSEGMPGPVVLVADFRKTDYNRENESGSG